MSSNETAAAQAYHQSPEQSVNGSESEPGSKNITTKSEHISYAGLERRSNPNAQANLVNDQLRICMLE